MKEIIHEERISKKFILAWWRQANREERRVAKGRGPDRSVGVSGLQIDGLIRLLRQRRHGFTSAEQALAAYIANNAEHVAFWSAERLGREAGVSDTTVVRFARTLGFRNYGQLQEFVQREISRLLQTPAPSRLRSRYGEHGDLGALWQSFRQDVANLEITLQHVDPDAFERTVSALVEARQRFVLGLRGSAPLATFLAYNLRGLLPAVRLVAYGIDDALDQVLEVGEGDVVVAFGLSRPSLRTVQFVGLACRRGATVVAVTNDQLSPLVELADHLLWISSASTAFTPSFTAGLSLCQALLTAVGHRVVDEAERRLAEVDEILVGQRVFAPGPFNEGASP